MADEEDFIDVEYVETKKEKWARKYSKFLQIKSSDNRESSAISVDKIPKCENNDQSSSGVEKRGNMWSDNELLEIINASSGSDKINVSGQIVDGTKSKPVHEEMTLLENQCIGTITLLPNTSKSGQTMARLPDSQPLSESYIISESNVRNSNDHSVNLIESGLYTEIAMSQNNEKLLMNDGLSSVPGMDTYTIQADDGDCCVIIQQTPSEASDSLIEYLDTEPPTSQHGKQINPQYTCSNESVTQAYIYTPALEGITNVATTSSNVESIIPVMDSNAFYGSQLKELISTQIGRKYTHSDRLKFKQHGKSNCNHAECRHFDGCVEQEMRTYIIENFENEIKDKVQIQDPDQVKVISNHQSNTAHQQSVEIQPSARKMRVALKRKPANVRSLTASELPPCEKRMKTCYPSSYRQGSTINRWTDAQIEKYLLLWPTCYKEDLSDDEPPCAITFPPKKLKKRLIRAPPFTKVILPDVQTDIKKKRSLKKGNETFSKKIGGRLRREIGYLVLEQLIKKSFKKKQAFWKQDLHQILEDLRQGGDFSTKKDTQIEQDSLWQYLLQEQKSTPEEKTPILIDVVYKKSCGPLNKPRKIAVCLNGCVVPEWVIDSVKQAIEKHKYNSLIQVKETFTTDLIREKKSSIHKCETTLKCDKQVKVTLHDIGHLLKGDGIKRIGYQDSADKDLKYVFYGIGKKAVFVKDLPEVMESDSESDSGEGWQNFTDLLIKSNLDTLKFISLPKEAPQMQYNPVISEVQTNMLTRKSLLLDTKDSSCNEMQKRFMNSIETRNNSEPMFLVNTSTHEVQQQVCTDKFEGDTAQNPSAINVGAEEMEVAEEIVICDDVNNECMVVIAADNSSIGSSRSVDIISVLDDSNQGMHSVSTSPPCSNAPTIQVSRDNIFSIMSNVNVAANVQANNDPGSNTRTQDQRITLTDSNSLKTMLSMVTKKVMGAEDNKRSEEVQSQSWQNQFDSHDTSVSQQEEIIECPVDHHEEIQYEWHTAEGHQQIQLDDNCYLRTEANDTTSGKGCARTNPGGSALKTTNFDDPKGDTDLQMMPEYHDMHNDYIGTNTQFQSHDPNNPECIGEILVVNESGTFTNDAYLEMGSDPEEIKIIGVENPTASKFSKSNPNHGKIKRKYQKKQETPGPMRRDARVDSITPYIDRATRAKQRAIKKSTVREKSSESPSNSQKLTLPRMPSSVVDKVLRIQYQLDLASTITSAPMPHSSSSSNKDGVSFITIKPDSKMVHEQEGKKECYFAKMLHVRSCKSEQLVRYEFESKEHLCNSLVTLLQKGPRGQAPKTLKELVRTWGLFDNSCRMEKALHDTAFSLKTNVCQKHLVACKTSRMEAAPRCLVCTCQPVLLLNQPRVSFKITMRSMKMEIANSYSRLANAYCQVRDVGVHKLPQSNARTFICPSCCLVISKCHTCSNIVRPCELFLDHLNRGIKDHAWQDDEVFYVKQKEMQKLLGFKGQISAYCVMCSECFRLVKPVVKQYVEESQKVLKLLKGLANAVKMG